MSPFPKQIAIHNEIPFEFRVPKANPIAYKAMKEEEFNGLMDGAAKSYADGRGIPLATFEKQLSKDIGV